MMGQHILDLLLYQAMLLYFVATHAPQLAAVAPAVVGFPCFYIAHFRYVVRGAWSR